MESAARSRKPVSGPFQALRQQRVWPTTAKQPFGAMRLRVSLSALVYSDSLTGTGFEDVIDQTGSRSDRIPWSDFSLHERTKVREYSANEMRNYMILIRVPVWFVAYVLIPLWAFVALKVFAEGRMGAGLFVAACSIFIIYGLRRRGYYGGREMAFVRRIFSSSRPGVTGEQVSRQVIGSHLLNAPSSFQRKS